MKDTNRLEVTDEGLINWLWQNGAKVEQVKAILKRKKNSDEKVKALKKLLNMTPEALPSEDGLEGHPGTAAMTDEGDKNQ